MIRRQYNNEQESSTLSQPFTAGWVQFSFVIAGDASGSRLREAVVGKVSKRSIVSVVPARMLLRFVQAHADFERSDAERFLHLNREPQCWFISG